MQSGPKTPVPTPSLVSSPESTLAAATSERPLDTAAHPEVREPLAPPHPRQLPPPACLGHALDNSPGHQVQQEILSAPPSEYNQDPTVETTVAPRAACESPCPTTLPFSLPFFFLIQRVYYFLHHLLVPYTCFSFLSFPLKCALDDVRDFCSQVYSRRLVSFSASSGRGPV